MIFHRTFLLSVIVASLICVTTMLAETPDALVAQALRQNPELNSYVASISAARGGVRTAATIRNPALSVHAGYKNSQDKSDNTLGDGTSWSMSIEQSFEYPGRIALRKAIAEGDVDLAELHLGEFRRTLAARIRTLAYNIASAEDRAAATREIGDRFKALSDVIAQRPAAGVTPQLEAHIIDANTLAFQRQERDAVLAATTMIAESNQLRGQPANIPLRVRASRLHFDRTSLPQLLKAARANAFAIRIRQAELAQQGIKVALSKNERYPAITVGPFYSEENAADKERQVGLGISLPLPLWDHNAGTIATNKAREQQAQAALLTTQREIERRVTQNVATLEAKRAEIEKWQTEATEKFREAADVADRNYRLGAVPLTIYVETQKQYFEIISALNDMQREALQAAQELEILTGLKFYHTEQTQ